MNYRDPFGPTEYGAIRLRRQLRELREKSKQLEADNAALRQRVSDLEKALQPAFDRLDYKLDIYQNAVGPDDAIVIRFTVADLLAVHPGRK